VREVMDGRWRVTDPNRVGNRKRPAFYAPPEQVVLGATARSSDQSSDVIACDFIFPRSISC